MNEGFIGDKIKKGFEKVKSLFRIGMKKIKGFITVFTSNGEVLPVISPQAFIDMHSGGSEAIKVYASKGICDSVVDAGGNPCQQKAELSNSDEMYNYGPDGDEFTDWFLDEKYKDTNEYKNLMSIPGIIKEYCSNLPDYEKNAVLETWEDVRKNRVSYHSKSGNGETKEIETIDSEEFASILRDFIDERIFDADGGDDDDDVVDDKCRNMIIMGAPGIGKSTIPDTVIKEFNKNCTDPSKMVSMIKIDCANIAVGDFMMPTVPTVKPVQKYIEENPDSFPESSEWLDSLSPEQKEHVSQTLTRYKQFSAGDAPKSWLPSYKQTGNTEVDRMLDNYANGGVFEDKKKKSTYVTGNGGIILFDEFLRSDPQIFHQLMNFFLERQINGWMLGSKWVIIACTNRPCDSTKVEATWADWEAAARDRFERILHLTPDPEQWKEWAKKKGCDQLLLDFIFEEGSALGDGADREYPRWHSIVKNSYNEQVKPVTPRTWTSAFVAINKYKKVHHLSSMSQMTIEEIGRTIKGYFDISFKNELLDWLDNHMINVSLDDIMEDPSKVKMPKAANTDDANVLSILVQNLYEQFSNKFKDNPDELTDDMLANIYIWFGINFKNELYTISNDFQSRVEEIYEERCFQKASMILMAAYPQKDIDDDIKFFQTQLVEENQWPEDSLEIIKGYMKEYFPWRLKGDKILYYDDLTTHDGDDGKEPDDDK